MTATLTTRLEDVEFVVVDTETTGGSPASSALTEVAAARFRYGARLGTYETLVDPGVPIPPFISRLTGIGDHTVRGAPPIRAVLPSFVAFVGQGVLVGHNLPFDVGFLNAALRAAGHPPLSGLCVDTLALARRLLRPDVPDCRLSTLASCLRLAHRPSHRALADVLATADLLHHLVERARGFDAEDLGSLLSLPARSGSPEVVPA